MTKRAVGYVSDIVLGRTGEVIGREAQKKALRRYAEENGYDLVAIFEDDVYDEDVISRPGIQRLLAFDEPYDCVLVERIWSLSRRWALLVPLLKEVQVRGCRVESSLCLWDCVSQRARHFYRPGARPVRGVEVPEAFEQASAARVAEPRRLHFVRLRRRPARA